MGGEREEVIKAEKGRGKKETTQIEGTNQSIRVHENKGEVHFHDDDGGMKCAVPVSVWWKAWERLKNPTDTNAHTFTYTDTKNMTVLFLEVSNKPDDQGVGFTLDAALHIHPLTGTNTTFDQIQRFTESKG